VPYRAPIGPTIIYTFLSKKVNKYKKVKKKIKKEKRESK